MSQSLDLEQDVDSIMQRVQSWPVENVDKGKGKENGELILEMLGRKRELQH